MPPVKRTPAIRIRLNQAQYRALKWLKTKLNLNKRNVIRLALTRLAEAENRTPRAPLHHSTFSKDLGEIQD
jgi:hypothetical protein